MKKITAAAILILSMFVGASIANASSGSQLIIINKSINRLAFFDGGKLVRVFKVATGRSVSLTPEGTFKIVNKIKNRPYYTDHIPGGDPRNPLGDRWLGLDARGTYGTTYAIHGNNNPASVGTYASSGCVRMYDEEIHWLFDQINLYTPVVITRSSQSFEAIASSYDYLMYSQVASVMVNEKSPQPVDTNIKISAKATKSDSFYRFEVFDGANWSTLQDFSISSQVEWKPSKPGAYKLKVQVKSKDSDKAFDDEKVITYDVFTPATLESVDVKLNSPQPINTAVTINAKTNSKENNKVKFSIFDGKKWTILQDYSAKTDVVWKPTMPGNYKMKIQTKHSISNKEFDQEKIIDYSIYVPAKINALQTNADGPQQINQNISIDAVTNDDGANLFKFLLKNGDCWTLLQDYSSNKSFTWKPSLDGHYTIKVQAKNTQSGEAFDAEQEINFIIYEPASLQGITSHKSNLLPIKSNINLRVVPKNTHDTEYRFSVYNGEEWVQLQDYSSVNILHWKPTKSGLYKVKVEVKNTYSKNDFDDSEEVTYLIYQAIQLVAVLNETTDIKTKKARLKKGTATYKLKA